MSELSLGSTHRSDTDAAKSSEGNARSMTPRRRCDLTVSQIAFLHDLELVSIVPVSPARNIPGCQDLDLGFEL